MKRFLTIASLLLAACLGSAMSPVPVKTPEPEIDVAFVIDCSISMTYALDGAEKKIVELVQKLQTDHPDALLRVGFIRYGDGTTHWTKFELTSDARKAYAFLKSLKADIGTKEFVGYFIEASMGNLAWGKDATKLVYVVGNESPHQGPQGFDITDTVPYLAANGFVVSSIYAGYGGKARTPAVEGQVQKEIVEWREIATLGKGEFINLYDPGK